ncbi:MAG: hypothetical protein NT154_25090 [Verrucomicrobia bacterium]|nr:hypothetical protein [Verrucomicrobiota bacterium]
MNETNESKSGIREPILELDSSRANRAHFSKKIQGGRMNLLAFMAAILSGCMPLLLTSPVWAGSCAPLQIQRAADGNVTLTWSTPACALQSATAATGPWNGVLGASSPYTGPAFSSSQFFRVISADGTCVPNVVAYYKQALASSPAGGLRHLLANPLNGTNNNLNTILPLPDAYLGTFIERWDVASQRFVTNVFQGAAAGWVPAASLNPGEGFFIHPVGPDPLVIIWIGEAPEGTLVNPLPPAGLRALRASIVPQTAPIGDPSNASTTLGFPAEDGDILELFDSGTQQFKTSYDYLLGFGWESATSTIPVRRGRALPRPRVSSSPSRLPRRRRRGAGTLSSAAAAFSVRHPWSLSRSPGRAIPTGPRWRGWPAVSASLDRGRVLGV